MADKPIILTLAKNLVYLDANGFPVYTLPNPDYTELIGRTVSTLLDTVDTTNDSVTALAGRVTTLEEDAGTSPVYPTMVEPDLMGNSNEYTIPEILHETINQFLDEKDVLDTPENLTAAVDTQGDYIADTEVADGTGNYSALGGWKSNPLTVADSLVNMWLVIGNLVTGVKTIKDLTAVSCKDVTINYVVVLSDNGATATIYLNGYSTIPSGFTDDGSTVTVTDSNGNAHTFTLDVVDVASNSGGVELALSGTSLNTVLDYTFNLEANLIKDSTSCSKNVIKEISNNASICPTVTLVPANTSISFVMTAPVTNNITYRLTLYDNEASPVSEVTHKDYTDPSSVTSDVFTGLSGDHEYYIVPTILIDGTLFETCPAVLTNTLS